MRAPFGWTVVRKGGSDQIVVYKRDCPAPDDLVPFTFDTREGAKLAGKLGHYAYRKL